MKLLELLNGDLLFPMLALLVVVIYLYNRIRNKRKFKK